MPRRFYTCFLCNFSNGLTKGFFLFPNPVRESSSLEDWLKSLNLKERPSDHSRLCFKHFKREDFLIGNARVDLKKGKEKSKFVKLTFMNSTSTRKPAALQPAHSPGDRYLLP